MRTMLRSKITLLFLTLGLLIAIPAIALGDVLTVNDVVTGGDVTKVSGESGQAVAVITASNTQPTSDANGCNATGSANATVKLTSSDTTRVNFGGNATDSQTTSGCGNNITFNYQVPATATAGTATITATATGGKSGSQYTSDSFTVTVIEPTPPDTTGPVITPHVDGTLGDNGWYVSDVVVTWDVVDDESEVTNTTGCDPTTISSDTTGQTLTCEATSGGGTSSESVTIKRDATAPDVTAGARDPDHNGWYNEPLTVSFSGTDATSDNVSCDSPVTYGDDSNEGDGTDRSVSGSCTDEAGNSAEATFTFDYDNTNPTIVGSRSPLANSNGWNNADVTVSFQCSDPGGSGVESCLGGTTLTTENANHNVQGTATDNAGNTANATVGPIKIDLTDPGITASLANNAANTGWYNIATGNPVVHFECTDALSGVASCPINHTITGEGNNLSYSDTATDKADNSASAGVNGVKNDQGKPTVSVTGITAATYTTTDTLPTPGCNVLDSVSGAANPSPSASKTADTRNANGVGSVTYTCTGTDNAGNSASAAKSFSVIHTGASGILQPINPDNTSLFSRGRAVPVKFQLAGDGANSSFPNGFNTSGWKLERISVNCTTFDAADAEAESVPSNTPSTVFRYDSTADQYIYNADFRDKAAGTCWKVRATLDDSTTVLTSAVFKLQK